MEIADKNGDGSVSEIRFLVSNVLRLSRFITREEFLGGQEDSQAEGRANLAFNIMDRWAVY